MQVGVALDRRCLLELGLPTAGAGSRTSLPHVLPTSLSPFAQIERVSARRSGTGGFGLYFALECAVGLRRPGSKRALSYLDLLRLYVLLTYSRNLI